MHCKYIQIQCFVHSGKLFKYTENLCKLYFNGNLGSSSLVITFLGLAFFWKLNRHQSLLFVGYVPQMHTEDIMYTVKKCKIHCKLCTISQSKPSQAGSLERLMEPRHFSNYILCCGLLLKTKTAPVAILYRLNPLQINTNRLFLHIVKNCKRHLKPL